MLKMILEYLPFLGIAILFNLATGLYNNLAVFEEKFSWKKFLIGLFVKAPIISFCFIAFAIIYDKLFGIVEVGSLEISPDTLIISVIVLYTVKATKNLMSILGTSQDNLVTLNDESLKIPRGDK